MLSRHLITLFITLIFSVVPSPSYAQEKKAASDKSYENSFNEELENGENEEGDRFVTELMNMLFVLGAIVAAMLMVTWILKKIMSTRLGHGNVASEIKVLEQRALSPKSILYLIEVQGKKIVIADSPQGMTRIAELD